MVAEYLTNQANHHTDTEDFGAFLGTHGLQLSDFSADEIQTVFQALNSAEGAGQVFQAGSFSPHFGGSLESLLEILIDRLKSAQ